MQIPAPYLLFLGDVGDVHHAKTAAGLAEWVPEKCLGQYRLPGCAADLGLADLTPIDAAAAGARTLIVGIANVGGFVAASWVPALVQAMAAGLDLAAGLHTRLADVPELAAAAERCGRRLFDVRHSDQAIPMPTAALRTGHRVLTVGTDCAIGKKFTALALTRELAGRGLSVDFRATGQTGILIAGAGLAVDAVKADFLAGAAEWLAPAAAAHHWDVIEGQGSLFHPAFAAVSLGLLHGAQPEAFILCHDPTRETIDDYPEHRIPPLAECIDLYVRLGRLTSPAIRCAGVSLNGSRLAPGDAVARHVRAIEDALGLPCVDPKRDGVARLAEALLAPPEE